jgi:hypothetical protein
MKENGLKVKKKDMECISTLLVSIAFLFSGDFYEGDWKKNKKYGDGMMKYSD